MAAVAIATTVERDQWLKLIVNLPQRMAKLMGMLILPLKRSEPGQKVYPLCPQITVRSPKTVTF